MRARYRVPVRGVVATLLALGLVCGVGTASATAKENSAAASSSGKNQTDPQAEATGTPQFTVKGKILRRYTKLGAENSALGEPIGNQYATKDGYAQKFQFGRIKLSSVTGKTTFSIAAKYQVPRKYRQIHYEGLPALEGCGFNLTPGMNGLKVQMVADKFKVTQRLQSMSPLLRSKVRTFQRKHDLKATGVVNKKTWLAMGFTAKDWKEIDCYQHPVVVTPRMSRKQIIETFIATAAEYQGKRYIWGGANLPEQGGDCSGIILQALYSVGIDPKPNTTVNHALPAWRSSRNLAALSRLKHVNLKNLKRGDVVFYAIGGGKINHCAIYLGNGKILEEAPGVGGHITSLHHYRGLQKTAVRPIP
ncbi:MAG: C40 family peptidase [Cellulomonadaceae bacterium]|jgi:cell wall-associated NlpC family hydrolase|nr:C40 family peptidase [Cellulomonadaceae bacterium]